MSGVYHGSLSTSVLLFSLTKHLSMKPRMQPYAPSPVFTKGSGSSDVQEHGALVGSRGYRAPEDGRSGRGLPPTYRYFPSHFASELQ